MALEAFQLPGYRLEMYAADHDPPHIHVIKDHWNIRVFFNLSTHPKINKVRWEPKYPSTLRKSPLSAKEEAGLLELMKTHKKELNTEWKKLHPERQGKKKGAEKKAAEKKTEEKKAKEGKGHGRSREK